MKPRVVEVCFNFLYMYGIDANENYFVMMYEKNRLKALIV